jgi:hypothetical protein
LTDADLPLCFDQDLGTAESAYADGLDGSVADSNGRGLASRCLSANGFSRARSKLRMRERISYYPRHQEQRDIVPRHHREVPLIGE